MPSVVKNPKKKSKRKTVQGGDDGPGTLPTGLKPPKKSTKHTRRVSAHEQNFRRSILHNEIKDNHLVKSISRKSVLGNDGFVSRKKTSLRIDNRKKSEADYSDRDVLNEMNRSISHRRDSMPIHQDGKRSPLDDEQTENKRRGSIDDSDDAFPTAADFEGGGEEFPRSESENAKQNIIENARKRSKRASMLLQLDMPEADSEDQEQLKTLTLEERRAVVRKSTTTLDLKMKDFQSRKKSKKRKSALGV